MARTRKRAKQDTEEKPKAKPKVAPKSKREEACKEDSPILAADNELRIIKKYKDRVKNPLSGIRSHCVECMGGAPQSVAECPSVFPAEEGQKATACSLWPFRMGKNAYDKRVMKRNGNV